MNKSRLLAAWGISPFLVAAIVSAAWADTPQESAARLKPAPGFVVQTVVGEPQIRQPVAIDFDERGRLWVMQYLQYPNPAGLKRVTVDRYSRTAYDRIPEPPPAGPRGEDCLTIVETERTSGSGGRELAPAAEVRTKDFVAGLNLASAFAFGYGGVFVLQTPFLLFYPDHDRDDLPDGDPQVLLRGFGMEDAHSVANSLTIGPDGWLYGCQGSTVTARIGDIEFQQGVWRYHPPSRRFELFCEGGGNSWGLDFDRHGDLLYSTNVGGHTMLHGVQGGYYWKSFGKHGALHNPFALGYFDHVPHENFFGGHVTVGGFFYRGQNFPPQFQGVYIAGDTLGHGVYWHHLSASGASFRSHHGGELLTTDDATFAPTDVCQGPDGCVYVADWRDARTAHPDPDADWDKTNGRVYRISFGQPVAAGEFDMGELSSEQLVDELDHPNYWRVRTARRLLAARRDGRIHGLLRTRLFQSQDPASALELLWALHVSGGLNQDDVRRLLSHDSPWVRRWVVRLVGDDNSASPEIARELARLAEADPSVHVRSQLASTARRLPADQAVPLLARLIRHDQDAADPHIPLLLWWAFERHVGVAREELVRLTTDPSTSQSPLVRDTIVPRLVHRLAASGDAASDAACVVLLDAWHGEPAGQFDRYWASLENGLKQRTSPEGRELSARLAQRVAAAWETSSDDVRLCRLAARTGRREPIDRLLALGELETAPGDKRALALRSVGEAVSNYEIATNRLLTTGPISSRLASLALGSTPPEVQLAAIDAWRSLGTADDAARMVDGYRSLPASARSALRTALLGRAETARLLLAAVESQSIESADFVTAELSAAAELNDAEVDRAIRRIWGNVHGPTPEEKLAEVRRLNNDLRAAPGDPRRGRELFEKHCSACHKLGAVGGQVGPDLTHANRRDRDFLLVSLVDPSNVVRKEYTSHVVRTTDGRILTGLIVRQTDAELTLLDAKGQQLSLRQDEVEELRESPKSLMPEELYRQLSPSELRDLFSFLQS